MERVVDSLGALHVYGIDSEQVLTYSWLLLASLLIHLTQPPHPLMATPIDVDTLKTHVDGKRFISMSISASKALKPLPLIVISSCYSCIGHL